MLLPSISQSFSPVTLLGPGEIFCAPGANTAPAERSVWFRAYRRSHPFSAREQDQLVPKLFTADVCLSSYSKTNKKMMEM